MAATTAPRKSISIYDYPEHLNPFHEEDNHNKIRFWTLGSRLRRSSSISFSGIKDLKNSWSLRSFMKKGKKGQDPSTEKSGNHVNGDTSPIIYRRALQYSSGSTGVRSTVGSPERGDRYVYGGSVTPLPRSRFQERLRSTSQHEVSSLTASPRMARSEVSGSRLSVESTNPFDEGPVPPVRASRRKKKRAPLPPSASADTTASSVTSELHITETENKKPWTADKDVEIDDMNLNIVELKIIEDEDVKDKSSQVEVTSPLTDDHKIETSEGMIMTAPDRLPDKENVSVIEMETTEITSKETDQTVKNTTSDENYSPITFRKVDISKYRRNSSVNEDDIRLRRGNLEDFQSLSNKRCKSLTNALDSPYTTYDIDLNDNTTKKDANGNDEPQKLVCKVYDETQRKQSIDTISSTEKEFLEIDRATRELEREINKLNSALNDDDLPSVGTRLSVAEIKRKFDMNDVSSSPNPIPKPRRSHYGGGSNSPGAEL